MVALFVLGYACIALEHPLKIDKSASALILCAVLWTIYIFFAREHIDAIPAFAEFQHFVEEKFSDGGVSLHEQVIAFVTEIQIVEHLGDVAQTLFYLIGAMTIVELIDIHGGFTIITDKIAERSKKKLLWIICVITFFMSAILDNLTTAIVMTMLLRKLVYDQHERWVYAGAIIISANSGGAFSPIGDVTTIMLWVKGMVTTGGLLPNLFIPSLLAMVVPVYLTSLMLKGQLPKQEADNAADQQGVALRPADIVTDGERRNLLIYGVAALIFVPIFKSITHLPPFIGVLFGLGVLWVYTEIMYHRKKDIPDSAKARITRCLGRIDFSTILFFLGILMAVATLQCSGILQDLAQWLREATHGNVYIINFIIGMLSSVVDNVPLVAGCMGMYDIPTQAQLAADPSLQDFLRDGVFWMFLAYCAGVGGSLLIIGSAAGVVVMGLEKINFVWYVKHFTLIAFAGYAAGALFYAFTEMVLRPWLGA